MVTRGKNAGKHGNIQNLVLQVCIKIGLIFLTRRIFLKCYSRERCGDPAITLYVVNEEIDIELVNNTLCLRGVGKCVIDKICNIYRQNGNTIFQQNLTDWCFTQIYY